MKYFLHRYIKIFYVLPIVFVLLLNTSQQVKASSWQKSADTPIFIGSGNDWDSKGVLSPFVLFDDNVYKMWYGGFNGARWQIGYAVSSDGISWTSPFDQPIISPNFSLNETDINDPYVIKDGSQYKMWYTSIVPYSGSGNEVFRINYAHSTDGINWVKSAEPVMRAIPASWESEGTSKPSVFKEGNTYLMWYSARDRNGLWRIGKATSTNGTDWNRNQNNPILSSTESWEMSHIVSPNVIKDGSQYKMWYHTGPIVPHNIVYAESVDGVNWVKPENKNPVLLRSSSGFDSVMIANPAMLKLNNKYAMYYSGFDGNRWSTGYATMAIESTSVPLLKQTANPWQDDVYDRANLWASNNPTIHRWGCAVTSAAMIFQYHGYKKLPDGTNLDPGTLNSWLNSQRDGYVGNGLVNWIALSRLSKLAKEVNNITTHDALEFSRTGKNNALLESDLENGNPAILLQPGHFIVGTQKLSDTFAINDPYHNRSSLKDGYGNTYQGLYRFIPSNTDLSYLMIVLPKGINADVVNESGNIVSQTYIEPAIIAQDNPSISSGDDTTVLLVPKPESGIYTLKINSLTPKSYTTTLYVYDNDGNPLELPIAGIANKQNGYYLITVDKENSENSSIKKQVTYSSILNELSTAYKNKLIKKSAYNALSSIIKSSQKHYIKKKIFQAKLKIDTSLLLISLGFSSSIEKSYKHILISDLRVLKSTL